MSKEWKASKKWNPFNSAKLMAHVDHWSNIERGKPVPPPVLVTIDPTNLCDLNCTWCNAKTVRKSGASISTSMLESIAEFLGDWGVKAVCIAGGGEPLLHEDFERLMLALVSEKIRVGLVTNGTHLLQHTMAEGLCDWVGVSVDAGSAGTYTTNKGRNAYGDVKHYMATLRNRVANTDLPLGKQSLGNGVFWKFLAHPSNVKEIYSAANQAKQTGCKGIHIRPAGTPWGPGSDEIVFSRKDLKVFNNELTRAVADLDDQHFSVYGVTHKFSKDLRPLHEFGKCRAVFMTAVIMPCADKPDGFSLGLCCDRRGDPHITIPAMERPEDIREFWGSQLHWDLADSIDVHHDCPRCTYAPHNELFERVIENDDMTHVFI